MKTLNAIRPHAHWLLRAAFGSVFVYHGALKLSNLEGFARMLPISQYAWQRQLKRAQTESIKASQPRRS